MKAIHQVRVDTRRARVAPGWSGRSWARSLPEAINFCTAPPCQDPDSSIEINCTTTASDLLLEVFSGRHAVHELHPGHEHRGRNILHRRLVRLDAVPDLKDYEPRWA